MGNNLGQKLVEATEGFYIDFIAVGFETRKLKDSSDVLSLRTHPEDDNRGVRHGMGNSTGAIDSREGGQK